VHFLRSNMNDDKTIIMWMHAYLTVDDINALHKLYKDTGMKKGEVHRRIIHLGLKQYLKELKK